MGGLFLTEGDGMVTIKMPDTGHFVFEFIKEFLHGCPEEAWQFQKREVPPFDARIFAAPRSLKKQGRYFGRFIGVQS